jgi:phosphoribosylanthranilate isomerase/glyoxylase-like metal-dependent hydrolase (beta-lactamase superfamily II)
MMSIDYFVWAIRGPLDAAAPQVIVVDTGMGIDAASRRPGRRLLTPVDQALVQAGIDLPDVRDVVITHMHYDHAGRLDLFPNATFHIQDSEMAFCTGRSMCHDVLRRAIDADDVVAAVRHVHGGRMRFHDGLAEIAPGITVHHVGGHTDGLQVVRVPTQRGWVVLASDATHLWANVRTRNHFPIVADVTRILGMPVPGLGSLREHGDVLTQIYGLTTVSDAAAVDRLGADHVGLVVDEGIETWDSVDEPTAIAVARTIQRSRLVALSLSTAPERIAATAALLQPEIVHLARAAEVPSSVLARLRDDLAGRQLMLTVPVTGEEAITQARRLASVGDYLLLDTSHPATGIVGATGITHDWHVSARIAAAVECPVVLAGGLGPDNVAEAVRCVRPAGVDSETRTSRGDDRRRKDLAKVETFIARAKVASAL